MDWIPDYIRGKNKPDNRYLSPRPARGCLRETYGVMALPEQVMEAAKIIAGYTLAARHAAPRDGQEGR